MGAVYLGVTDLVEALEIGTLGWHVIRSSFNGSFESGTFLERSCQILD